MLIDSSQHFSCHLFLLLFWFWISQYCEESNEKPPQSTKFHPGGCQLDGCCRLLACKVLYTVHVQLRLQSVTDSHDDSIHPSRFLSILEAHTSKNSKRIFFF